MTGPNTVSAFQALVERYEHDGWAIRTIDRTALRATVRAADSHDFATANGPAPASVCRKLWVDAQGKVQETDVPC
jgi:hypothetical protein